MVCLSLLLSYPYLSLISTLLLLFHWMFFFRLWRKVCFALHTKNYIYLSIYNFHFSSFLFSCFFSYKFYLFIQFVTITLFFHFVHSISYFFFVLNNSSQCYAKKHWLFFVYLLFFMNLNIFFFAFFYFYSFKDNTIVHLYKLQTIISVKLNFFLVFFFFII